MLLALASAMDRRARRTRREPYYPLNLAPYVFQDWPISSAKARAELDFVPTPLEQGACQTIKRYREIGFLNRRR